jgi:carboxymethylenebutenolidase
MTRVRDVVIDAPGGALPAFFARSFDFPNPTVIVIQEWWGLDGHIQDVTLRFTSSHEWSAIAPDLYRGKQPTEPDDAQKVMMELDRDQVLADLKATVGWLARQGATKIGVIGFCMGGSIAMDLAHEDDRVTAVAAFYGMTELEGRSLKAPLQAHFAGHDSITPEQQDAVRTQIDGSAYGGEVFVYPDSKHAFFNDSREDHDPEASELAWERALEFFGKHLN